MALAMAKQFTVKHLSLPSTDIPQKTTSIPLLMPENAVYNPEQHTLHVKGDRSDTLVPYDTALELLKTIDKPVAVLAIAGPTRTGKSYILSRILGDSTAFELGHTTIAHTKGIWMSTSVLECSKYCILLLDTEGIDAVNDKVTNDAMILVSTLLLSSYFIYNSPGVPRKPDLERMNIFTNMANSIVVRHGMQEADEHWKYLPPFLWLLRDVLTKMPTRDGRELTPTEYLKTEVLFGDSSKDSVRKALSQFFPSFECRTLPPPSTSTDVMESVSKTHEDLDPKFNQGVDELIAFLKDNIEPKKVFDAAGSACDGSTLAALVEQVSEQVNKSDSIPAFDNTWKMVVESRCRAVQERLLTEYSTTLKAKYNEASQGDPLEEVADHKCKVSLMGIHNSLLPELTKKLNDELGPLLSSKVIRQCTLESVTKDFQNQLVQFQCENAPHTPVHVSKVVGGALLPVIEENQRRSRDFCNKLFTDLYTPIREKVLTETEDKYTPENLVDDFEKLLQEYDAKSVGPEKWNVRAETEITIKQNKELLHKHLQEMLKHVKREREQREMHENLRKELQTLVQGKKQSDERLEEIIKLQQEAEESRKQEVDGKVKKLTEQLEEQKQKQERMNENERKRRSEEAQRLSEETFKKEKAQEKVKEMEENMKKTKIEENKRTDKANEEIRKMQQNLEEQKKKETIRKEKAKQEIEELRERLKKQVQEEECRMAEAAQEINKMEKTITHKEQNESEEKAKHERTLREKSDELHQQQLRLVQMKNEHESMLRKVNEEKKEQERLKELAEEDKRRTEDRLNQVIETEEAEKERSEENWKNQMEDKEAETEELSNNISILTEKVQILEDDIKKFDDKPMLEKVFYVITNEKIRKE